jgi:hypothetical protein
MLKSWGRVLESVDAFRKSRGGTRRISVSIRLDPDKALAAFKKLARRIEEALWK